MTEKTKPTQQEMALDLAEKVMGWTLCQCNLGGKPCGQIYDGVNCKTSWNPFGSRDDCAELLGRLTDEQKQSTVTVLRNALCEETPVGGWLGYWLLLTATPAQIAEAVWRATC